MTTAKKNRPIKQMTLAQFEAAFPTEDSCKAYLSTRRWPTGVRCPRCDNDKVYALPSKPYHWQCQACTPSGYRFSVLVGTIFENTNVPLQTWFKVIYLMMTSKKGISALQIQRMLGMGSYRTAWSMCHRIRAGMADEKFQQLMGFVEVDETYVGGEDANRHADKQVGNKWLSKSAIVIGAVQRGGSVVARVIDRTTMWELGSFVDMAVSSRVSLLSTDTHVGYQHLSVKFPHKTVNHAEGQYVIGAIHTNTIEGFWSLVKRGVVGTFHRVSKKYLPLYVAEFAFRYNNRKNADIFGAAVATC